MKGILKRHINFILFCWLVSGCFKKVCWSSWSGRLPVTQEVTSSSLVQTAINIVEWSSW